MALGDALRQARERHPDKPAVRVGEPGTHGVGGWSYGELDQLTDAIAANMQTLGLSSGDRVALHFTNGLEIVLGYYACFKLGLIAVPLNVRLKGPELEYVLQHSGARLYLGQPDLFPEVQAVRSRLPELNQYYLSSEHDAFPEVGALEALITAAGPARFPAAPPDAPAVILYTSGTTARPKGVTHTHGTLERTGENYREYSGLTGDDVVGIVLSLAHIFAFALLLLPTVAAGATLVLLPQFEPAAALRAFEQHGVTHCGALPLMYNALVNCSAAAVDLGGMKFCLAGGDAVPPELQRCFQERFGVPITEACGMTEVIPYAGNPRGGGGKTGSIGRPTPGVRLRLVDAAGHDVPPGEVGEILVHSPGAMVGYWNDPAATAATLQDGWLRTGDLGRVDEDGYYWFVGRQKEIIVRGGSNISPLEVEEALYEHPAVREAGVVGVPDEAWGEVVHAYVVRHEGAAVEAAELTQFLAGRLAAYKIPESVIFLPELPKGLTGKLQRKALRDRSIAAKGSGQ
jgi:long-chain acyl-CoA synthetase